MSFKMTESDLQESFEASLDDTYPEVTICGITFSPSRVLREMDPIGFQVSMSDYADNMDIEVCEEHELDTLGNLWDAEFNESADSDMEDEYGPEAMDQWKKQTAYAKEYDDSMDGDAESALASAGWGTDEDYGSASDMEEY